MLQREGAVRIPSGCAISGMIHKKGERMPGDRIVSSISYMHDRSNGLGGGFAGYGIYPEYKNQYALHLFYDDDSAKSETEHFLERHFDVFDINRIPTRQHQNIANQPLIMRYFVNPKKSKMEQSALDEREFITQCVININHKIKGSYVFSSGKNMGVFKAVGFPEDVGEFYCLEQYKGYCWTAHGRYPTNTPGWWGGAHPFALLDYSVVHNGEISSYDANRRFIEMFGYQCDLLTDTEVITYMIDYLSRRQGIGFQDIASILAAPFWSEIEQIPEPQKHKLTYFRNVFSSMLITGPFSIMLGFEGGLMALNDRLKLRSMVVAEKGDITYIASEECAIRAICPDAENIWSPRGGEPVIVTVEG
ncbi:MAG: hypothetical protein DBY25_02425 [Clostridiales bacterium]|nr:MAG: hypothetical protein DBY25_02425 [Clostridiales bacterium]